MPKSSCPIRGISSCNFSGAHSSKMPEKLSVAKRGQHSSPTEYYPEKKRGKPSPSHPLHSRFQKFWWSYPDLSDIQGNRKTNEETTEQIKSLFCKNWDELSRRFIWVCVCLYIFMHTHTHTPTLNHRESKGGGGGHRWWCPFLEL